jgi:hypothetical protein
MVLNYTYLQWARDLVLVQKSEDCSIKSIGDSHILYKKHSRNMSCQIFSGNIARRLYHLFYRHWGSDPKLE